MFHTACSRYISKLVAVQARPSEWVLAAFQRATYPFTGYHGYWPATETRRTVQVGPSTPLLVRDYRRAIEASASNSWPIICENCATECSSPAARVIPSKNYKIYRTLFRKIRSIFSINNRSNLRFSRKEKEKEKVSYILYWRYMYIFCPIIFPITKLTEHIAEFSI